MKLKKMIRKGKNLLMKPKEQVIIMPDEICVCCGKREYIPEGSIICSRCRKLLMEQDVFPI